MRDSQGRSRTLLVGLVNGSGGAKFDVLTFVKNTNSDLFTGTSDAQNRVNNYASGGTEAISYDVITGRVTSGATQFIDLGIGATLSLDFSALIINTGGARQSSAVDFLGVETASRALGALDALDRRRTQISTALGQLGAVQSRAESALKVINVARENVVQAASRITDVDVASESSSLLRQSILQQAASAVLAQANQQPALAIQLLGG